MVEQCCWIHCIGWSRRRQSGSELPIVQGKRKKRAQIEELSQFPSKLGNVLGYDNRSGQFPRWLASLCESCYHAAYGKPKSEHAYGQELNVRDPPFQKATTSPLPGPRGNNYHACADLSYKIYHSRRKRSSIRIKLAVWPSMNPRFIAARDRAWTSITDCCGWWLHSWKRHE
jgi:hypothetical protein